MMFAFLLGSLLVSEAVNRYEVELNGTKFYMNETSGLYINGTTNITGLAYYNDSLICTAANGLCTGGGSDGNNYTTAVYVSNGSTHTITLTRNGMVNLSATFDDQNTGGGGGVSTVQSLDNFLIVVNGSTANFSINQSKWNTTFLRNSSVPDCSAAQFLRSDGNGELLCDTPSDSVGITNDSNARLNNLSITTNLTVTSNAYVGGSLVCTTGNGLCTGGSSSANLTVGNFSLLQNVTLGTHNLRFLAGRNISQIVVTNDSGNVNITIHSIDTDTNSGYTT